MNYEQIVDRLDRSSTRPLINELLSDRPDAEERHEIERALIGLDDVRAVIPLQAAGENSAIGPVIRSSALNVITSMLGARALPIREWWASHDPVLRFAASGVLGSREFADLVAPVLDDPAHPMTARVLASMDLGFEEPVWQERKCRALRHRDPHVRAAAATALLWDEPLVACSPLIDAARDLDVDVAVEAVSTLMYYPTSNVVETLAMVGQSPNPTLARAANVALHRVLGDIRDAVDVAPDAGILQRWAGILRAHGASPDDSITADGPLLDDLDPAVVAARAAVQRPLQTSWSDELERQLGDPDGCWSMKYAHLAGLDPDTVAVGDRDRVLTFLTHHPDPEVRAASARLVVGWTGGVRAALALLDDPMGTVAKAAMFALYDAPSADPRIGQIVERSWAAVCDERLTGTRASEALRTFVRHAAALDAPGGLVVASRLAGLLDDARESVRAAAVEQLVSLGEVDVLTTAMRILGEPPEVTWAVHGTLLDAAHRFAIPVDRAVLDRLGAEDHAWLVAASARLLSD